MLVKRNVSLLFIRIKSDVTNETNEIINKFNQ